MKKITWQQSYVWLLLYAVAVVLSSGRLSFAVATWFVAFFALRFIDADHGSLKKQMKQIYLVTWIGLSATWYGATPIWGLAHFVFMGINAAFSVLPYLAYELLRRRWPRSFGTTLLFPAAFVTMEWATAFGSPFGSFGASAYSQYGFLPIMQLASVTGLLGISFLVAWLGAAAAWALRAVEEGRRWVLPAAIPAVIVALVFGWGALRLANQPESDARAEVSVVGLTASPVSMQALMPLLNEDEPEFRRRTSEAHAAYLEESRTAGSSGANLVVWPEAAGVGTFDDVAALTEEAAGIAAEYGLYMVIPTMSLDPAGSRQAINKAVLLSPDGSVIAEHVKFGGNFIEGTAPGEQRVTVADTEIGRIGLAICWDADFPTVMAEAGREDVEMLIVTALDWEGINPMHGQMAVFRAIENGTYLVRQADKGWSMVTDPYGRVLAEGQGPDDRVQAQITPRSISTLYPKIGNALGPISAGALAILTVVVLGTRRKRRNPVTHSATNTFEQSA